MHPLGIEWVSRCSSFQVHTDFYLTVTMLYQALPRPFTGLTSEVPARSNKTQRYLEPVTLISITQKKQRKNVYKSLTI